MASQFYHKDTPIEVKDTKVYCCKRSRADYDYRKEADHTVRV